MMTMFDSSTATTMMSVQGNDHGQLFVLSESLNEGLALLFEGHLDRAKHLLVQCLRHIHNRLVQYEQVQENHQPVMIPSSSTCHPLFTLRPTPLDFVLAPHDWPFVSHPAAGGFSIFRAVFAIHQVDDDEGDEQEAQVPHAQSVSSLRVMAAVAAFNLGVMYHEIGMVEGSLPDLTTARTLYQMAVGIWNKVREESNDIASSLPDASLLEMALYNNMGHACAFLMDSEGCAVCYEYLQNRAPVVLPRLANVTDDVHAFLQASLADAAMAENPSSPSSLSSTSSSSCNPSMQEEATWAILPPAA